MTPHIRMSAAFLTLTAVLALGAAGCSQPAAKSDAKAEVTSASVASPDTYPFRIGQLEAVALKDGDLTIPNDAKVIGVGQPVQAVRDALAASGQPGDSIHLSIQPLLIRDGDKLVLIDTGAGGQMGTQNKLQASLRAAGAEPGQITDILISHGHGDHVGGLVGADGKLAFPNAVIRISAAEWRDLQGQAQMADLVKAITPKVQTFEPGAVVAPNITSVALNGHTVGHTGYEIASGSDRLLYIGDVLHSSALSVQKPDWINAWDTNGATGAATRKSLLQRAAADDLRLYAVHFPFPGLGHVRKQGETYVWAPEGATPASAPAKP